MTITAKCRRCGHEFSSRLFGAYGVTGTIVLSNNKERCPVPGCEGWADTQAGKFEFVNGVIAAFTAPGMTRAKVEAVRDVAAKASRGEMPVEEAVERLEKVSSELAAALRGNQSRKVNWEFLVAIIALIYTFWSDFSSDSAAQAALAESQTQTEVARKMLEVLQEQPDAAPSNTLPKGERQQASRSQMTASKNRRARSEARKAALRRGSSLSSPIYEGD